MEWITGHEWKLTYNVIEIVVLKNVYEIYYKLFVIKEPHEVL